MEDDVRERFLNGFPLKLEGERVWRTYIGGKLLDEREGKFPAEDYHFPEEWMYSTTRAFNAGRENLVEGLSCLSEKHSVTLKALIERFPEFLLGTQHQRQWGSDLGVLIKQIDSQERLTVQVHPDKKQAMALFHSRFGKTECWNILGTRKAAGNTESCIYLGFKENITKEVWEQCFEEQDFSKMLSLMNRLEVNVGETYLVEGGTPHAIGAGCHILEIQEPTDLTIRVEKTTPSGFRIADSMCHQGLGFAKMFECFRYEGLSEEQVRQRWAIVPQLQEKGEGFEVYSLVSYENTSCFRMEKIVVHSCMGFPLQTTFSCLYVFEGEGELIQGARSEKLKANDQFFIPAQVKPYTIRSISESLTLFRIYGPFASAMLP